MTTHSAERRYPIRLGRAICIAVATVLILGIVAALRIWIPAYRWELASGKGYHSGLGLGGYSVHPLDERKQELESLIDSVERGETLTKRDVVSRLGKPDRIQGTRSKEYLDRCISTTYRYALPPGEYIFPNWERAGIGQALSVEFYFNE